MSGIAGMRMQLSELHPPVPALVPLAAHGPAIDCLCCGGQRLASYTPAGNLDGGECPHCSYVGWVRAGERDKLRRRARALTVLPHYL